MIDIFSLGGSSGWERIQLWKGTWNMIKEHPVLGFGINTYSKYFPLYKPPDYPDIRYAHNSYLQMWSEIGLVGLGVFLCLIFAVLKNALCKIREKINKGFLGLVFLGLLAGYIAFLVQSAFDTNLYSLVLFTLFWVMTAYLVCLDKYLKGDTNA
jgi:O-antigen ligase